MKHFIYSRDVSTLYLSHFQSRPRLFDATVSAPAAFCPSHLKIYLKLEAFLRLKRKDDNFFRFKASNVLILK